MKIEEILKATNGNLIIGDKEYECENFSRDTRKVKKGDTYIALKGDSFDGNEFWMDALDNGADTVIIEKDISKELLPNGKNIIQVEDTKKALMDIAKAKREKYKDLIVVGVTGSVGKTSTKDIIANVLSQKYKTLKTQGNLNNTIGLPFTILNLRDHEAAVIEMGMNHLGEISELTKIAKPTLSVITNIGTSHIGNLGSRENILKAKLEILEGMETPKIVINNDNDMLNKWAQENKIETHTFGIKNKSECMASKIDKNENDTNFIANMGNEEIKVHVPVGGEAFVLNALCSIVVGKLLGLSNEQIQKGISTFELTKKRMEIISLKNNITVINDSYNASYDSMKSALEYLSQTNSKRKIAVLGDMFELGQFSEELHKKVGKEVAKNKIDKLFALGKDAKYIAEEAEKNGIENSNIFYTQKREELVETIKNTMEDGDAILFKASNGMRLFEIVEELKNND